MRMQVEGARLVAPGEGKSCRVVQDKVLCRLSGKDTGGEYALFDIMVPPGGGPPAHWHTREDEIFYVISGTFELLTGTTNTVVTAGAVAFMPRDHIHTYRNCGEGEGHLVVMARPAGIETMFEEIDKLGDDPAKIDSGELAAIIRKYGLEFQSA